MNWKKLSSESAYRGWRKIDRVSFAFPDGHTADFEIKNEGIAVCVLPLTSDNQVILAKQFRPGPEKVLMELPGGGAHAGEDFTQAIARELLEETGYQGEITFVGTSIMDAYSSGIRHNFLARNCVKVQEPENDPQEPIEVVLLSLNEFRHHLQTGELSDVTTGYLALDFANLL